MLGIGDVFGNMIIEHISTLAFLKHVNLSANHLGPVSGFSLATLIAASSSIEQLSIRK